MIRKQIEDQKGIRTGFATDVGNVREINEDSLFVDEDLGLFIVADGMGGHQGGEVASKLAVECIHHYIKNAFRSDMKEEDIMNIIRDAILMADEKIKSDAEGDKHLDGMGTTVVLALSYNNGLYIAHAGDSRAYHIGQGQIKQLTEDHSVVVKMLKKGVIVPEEARTHHLKNMITQALGMPVDVMPDIQFIKWVDGDYIMLCSDGLTDMLDDEELLNTVLAGKRSPEKGCQMLVELANEKGGKDNITVIILHKN